MIRRSFSGGGNPGSNSEPGIKQYLYIVQAYLETAKCKIGVTNNLKRRLKEYNSTTGKSKDNVYSYLFTCEVKNMRKLEADIKNKFPHLRESSSREIYFCNQALFDTYVDFIRSHELFINETFIKEKKEKTVIKYVKKLTPSLQERGLTRKDVMQHAKKVDNDEFFTRYEDIEKEISMYPVEIWEDKCVFCNCDDAVGDMRKERDSSAFALYFIKNFFRLGLKKLICIHYAGKDDIFNAGAKGYIFTKDGVQEMTDSPRGFGGSFDGKISLKILQDEADIVCTNPPFSRSRDFWRIIINSGKKFLIISNIANCSNTAYIPYFIKKQVWAGFRSVDWYLNPKREPVRAAGHWFTNIPITDRQKYSNIKFAPLNEIPDDYKKYDDSGTLLVDNNYIPTDYEKPFAVTARTILNGILEKGYKIIQGKRYEPYLKSKLQFARILIQKEY